MGTDGTSPENSKPKKNLSEYIDQVKKSTFSSPGHDKLAETEPESAKIAEIRNRVGVLSLTKKENIDGTADQWQELKQLYLDVYTKTSTELEHNDKVAFNRIDKMFGLPVTYPEVE